MKRVIVMALFMCFILSTFVYASPLPPDTEMVIIPYKNEEIKDYNYVVARYEDTKEIIPFSWYYDGNIFTYAKKGAGVEAYLTEEVVFTDDVDGWEARGAARFLAQRGVICGNVAGEILLDSEITYAQLIKVLVTLFEIPLGESTGEFWYTPALEAAESAGITKIKLEPDKKLTRQEVVQIIYDAFLEYGLIEYRDITVTGEKLAAFVSDYDTLGDAAKEAYGNLFYYEGYVMEDNVERSGYDDGDYYVEHLMNSDKFATRKEAFYFLYSLIGKINIFPSSLAIELGFDKDMPVIDGSTSTYDLTYRLFYNLFGNYELHEKFTEEHSKTIEAYENLIYGKADIIFVPDPSEEIIKLAADENVELKYIPISYEALVFFTNQDNTSESVSKENLQNIYIENNIENWKAVGGPDATLAAYCRNYDSGSHAQMEQFILDGRDIHGDIISETTSRAMQSIITDVMEYRKNNPDSFAIGYSVYYYFTANSEFYDYLESPIKLLAIDDIYPTEESIRSGEYPFTTNYYAVIRASDENSAAAKLAAWLTESYAQSKMIRGVGMIPLTD